MILAAVVAPCGCAEAVAPAPVRGSIQRVVIVVKENHSFDNYFGSLENPPASLPHCTSRVTQESCQYDSSDLPAYYRYAREFGYADRYFSDVRGPSWPNDMMMIAAQSPLVDDPPPPLSNWICPVTCYDLPTIGESLSAAHLAWRNYGEDLYDPFRSIRSYASDRIHNVDMTQFFADVGGGRLPAVAWVRPAAPDSEHPGYDVERGERWSVNVINAIMRSRFWSSTAILVTWDDAGDVQDHVSPLVVERSATGKAVRYGQRLPLLVLSAFTLAGTVSHQLLSHVSTLKFIEDLYHLEPLTDRDRGAYGLDEFFDFSNPARRPVIMD